MATIQKLIKTLRGEFSLLLLQRGLSLLQVRRPAIHLVTLMIHLRAIGLVTGLMLSDLRSLPLFIQVAGDGVESNDAVFNKVFPYESTPQNGRNHKHR